jgi:hypothetical protein
MKTKNEAVKVNGNQVVLEVAYCIPNVESDSNTFSEIIGGCNDTTKAQATAAVIESAKAWANRMRAEGHEISVWDEAGNQY